MKKPRDPMIATALEYESATLDTLRALDGTDGRRRSACLHFDAMAAMEAMPDRDRGLTYLMQRGRILAWKTDYTPRWKSLPRTSARRFTEPPRSRSRPPRDSFIRKRDLARSSTDRSPMRGEHYHPE